MKIRWFFKLICTPIDYFNHSKGQITVVMYHSVGANENVELDIDFPLFKKQLRYLLSIGKIIDIDTALSAFSCEPNKRYFVLTFDDGYSNFYTTILPTLKKLKIPATLYPALKFIDDPSQVPIIESSGSWKNFRPISVEQLRSISKSNLITIGSHGYHHISYDRENLTELKNDINKSLKWFRKNLNFKPKHFCYPRGESNSKSERLIGQYFFSGVKAAYSPSVSIMEKKYSISRVPALRSDGFFWFKKRMKGKLFSDIHLIRFLSKSFIFSKHIGDNKP